MPCGFNGVSSTGPQLHSWVYPQSTLPPSLISVLTSTAAEGGTLLNCSNFTVAEVSTLLPHM